MLGDGTASVLLFFGDEVYLFAPGSWVGSDYPPMSATWWAYHELGIPPAPEVQKLVGENVSAAVPQELLPELKADHLTLFPNAYGDAKPAEGFEAFTRTPIWKAILAVKNGNAYTVQAESGVQGYWTTPHLFEALIKAIKTARAPKAQ